MLSVAHTAIETCHGPEVGADVAGRTRARPPGPAPCSRAGRACRHGRAAVLGVRTGCRPPLDRLDIGRSAACCRRREVPRPLLVSRQQLHAVGLDQQVNDEGVTSLSLAVQAVTAVCKERIGRSQPSKQLQLRSTRDAEYLFLRRLPHCYRPPHRMPNPAAGLDSSGFFCFLGKRDLLAAFKQEPHKRREQHKF